ETVELLGDLALGVGKGVGGSAIKALLDDFGDRRVQAVEEIRQVELELLERLLMAMLNDGHAGARQHAWRLALQGFVDGANLREVSNLCRPADVGGGRQEPVLHDGPQRHVRAEAVRTARRQLRKLGL